MIYLAGGQRLGRLRDHRRAGRLGIVENSPRRPLFAHSRRRKPLGRRVVRAAASDPRGHRHPALRVAGRRFSVQRRGKGVAIFGFGRTFGRHDGLADGPRHGDSHGRPKPRNRPSREGTWQYAAFVLGMLFMASIRWASLDPTDATILAAPWLHRSISLLLSAAMMCLLASFGLPQVAKRIWAALFPAPPLEGRSTRGPRPADKCCRISPD